MFRNISGSSAARVSIALRSKVFFRPEPSTMGVLLAALAMGLASRRI
ncbi:MAG TPA: PEP-CTERM sorting domain-containing protein [Firmicutes bacterium]|nr:PEP-CTERM sorting domain-containing protein [Bacillota bacterium]